MAFAMIQPTMSSNRRLYKPRGVSLSGSSCIGCPYHSSEMAALGYVSVGLSGLDGLDGWFKRVKKAVKKGISQPLKALAVMSVVGAPLMMMKKETRGRILRRAGGVVTGCATGFAGGIVGCIAGGVTGGLMAKKGVKGIKGYGKIGLISAATGFTAGAVAGAAGYGAYGGFGAKAYAFGASKIAGLTAGKVASGTSLIPSVMGIIPKRSSAPVEETTSGGAPTGEGLYSDNWQTAPRTDVGQSYMDLVKQTASAVSSYIEPTQPIATNGGGTWGGGEGQSMPDPTGANIPGQEPIAEEATVFAGLTSKNLLMMGGIGLVLIMMYKK